MFLKPVKDIYQNVISPGKSAGRNPCRMHVHTDLVSHVFHATSNNAAGYIYEIYPRWLDLFCKFCWVCLFYIIIYCCTSCNTYSKILIQIFVTMRIVLVKYSLLPIYFWHCIFSECNATIREKFPPNLNMNLNSGALRGSGIRSKVAKACTHTTEIKVRYVLLLTYM